ncbi:MAG: hypothetical protein B6U68_02145 [Candidatus Aenigmarchaeota archaeon ex4484_14]|nr:MAG: hypothetical protein B6U68_02145 [Candidatus Aenigmarchaeota archaeon ex4484_14]
MVEILGKLKRGIVGIKSRFSRKPDLDIGMIKDRVNAPMTKPLTRPPLEPLRAPGTEPAADLRSRFMNEPPEPIFDKRLSPNPPILPPPIHRPEPTHAPGSLPTKTAPAPDFYAGQGASGQKINQGEDITLIRKELSSISARLDTIDQRLRIIEGRIRR